MLTICVMIITV